MSNSPPPNRLPALLLLGIAVFGPPTVATLAFTHAITQNLWLTVILVVLYEVIVFIVSIVGKIWQKLESTWIDQIAQWLDLRIRGILSGYRGYYCQHLIYQHRDFDVKGLSTQGTYTLDLEQVFVELSIDPKPAHQTSSDPLQVPEASHTGGRIWDYLTSKPLATQHLVIIGVPGSGKTTLLKHLALLLVAQKKHRPKIMHTLPLLLFLRDHVNAVKDNPTFSLVDAVHAQLSTWDRPVPPGWVEHYLTRGCCLVLLDGLDEVADPETRRRMVDWVQRQMGTYGKNRFIVTSRPFGYRSNPLSGVAMLEVRPFTSEQIKQFVHNWYLANELMSSQRDDPGVRMKAKESAEDLFRRLRNTPALFALAVNPLLLTMIATVHRYRSSLPGKRVALYAEICEVFLGKRQEARGLAQELTAAQKQQVLQPLAYQMMRKGIREIPLAEACQVIVSPLALVSTHMQPEAFLQLVENSSGVLLEREHGIYSFAHLTFQEYLAAAHVKDESLEHLLVDQVGASWWHETIRLYCAQADATALIAACLAGDRPSVPALTLALECQQEALKVQPSVRTQLDVLLDKGIEDPDPERRRLVAEAMLTRRLRQMVHLYEEIYVDTSLVTCAEYQIFLDDQRARSIYHQPDHWETDSFPSGQGHAPALGVRPSDATAFCTWLTERDPGTWRYRLPTGSECEKIEGDKSVAVKLMAGTGYWMSEGIGFAWARGTLLPSDSINNMLRDLFTDDRDLTRALARARDLTRALDLARARDLDLALDLARALALASALASALDLALALARARDLDLALDLARARAIDLALYRALDLDRARARDLARAMDRAMDRALKRDRTIKPISTAGEQRNNKEEAAFLRWYIRFSAQVLAVYLRYLLLIKSNSRTWIEQLANISPDDDLIEGAISNYLDIYVTFALLEARIQGKLPAWEGILLVKERKKEN